MRPAGAGPVRWGGSRQRHAGAHGLARSDRVQLVAVEHVLPRARGEQEVGGHRGVGRGVGAEHRHQRDEARASADQEQRLRRSSRRPDEVPPDRAAELEDVADLGLAHEPRGDLAVVDQLDRQAREAAGGRGREGVRALRLVAVLGGQADIDVLAGDVAGPAVDVQLERPGARGLRRPPSARSPSARRAARAADLARLVAPVALLQPWVAAVVVAGGLPEAGVVLLASRSAPAPTWRSSRSTGAAPAGGRGRRARAPRASRRTPTPPRPCRRARPRAAGSSCSRHRTTPPHRQRWCRRPRARCRPRPPSTSSRASTTW